MRAIAVPAVVSAAALVLALPATAQDLASGRWIDLTHPFNADSVYWPTAEMFELEEVFHGHTEGGWYYTAYNFSAAEHGGTHLDAPIHFAEGALTADAIPVDQMIGPGLVIDVSEDRSDLRVFINPEITRREGVAQAQEGCLSVPGIYDNVERAESVTVTALDRSGARFTLNASGLLAACIQHEMDHLTGRVFVEYLSELKQNRIRAKLKKRQRKAA